MKSWRLMSVLAVVLAFGGAVFVQAQRPQDNRRPQDQRGEHGQMQQQRNDQRPPRQMQRTERQRRDQEQQQQQEWQHRRLADGRWPSNWGQRGGYHGQRIPGAYFRGHFGWGHRFRVYNLPFQVADGSPRFQYNGYWFQLAGPAPAYWGPDWYRNDDMFVVYAYGGYYLDNARFPNRPGVALSVIF